MRRRTQADGRDEPDRLKVARATKPSAAFGNAKEPAITQREALIQKVRERIAEPTAHLAQSPTVFSWKVRYDQLPGPVRALLEERHPDAHSEIPDAYRHLFHRLKLLGVDPLYELLECIARAARRLERGETRDRQADLLLIVILVFDELRPLAEATAVIRWEGYLFDEHSLPKVIDPNEALTRRLVRLLNDPNVENLKALEEMTQNVIDRVIHLRRGPPQTLDALPRALLSVSYKCATVRYSAVPGWTVDLPEMSREILRTLRDTPGGCTRRHIAERLGEAYSALYEDNYVSKARRRLERDLKKAGAPFEIAHTKVGRTERWYLRALPV